MKISYNWIRKYISFSSEEINLKKISNILTNIGLSVNNINEINKQNFEKDYIFDIEITPNRTDAMNHYGIARDLYIALKYHKYDKVTLKKVSTYSPNNFYKQIRILIDKNCKECIRYSGILIDQKKNLSSPNWLVSKLESIEIKSKNFVIDSVMFVMYELGFPMNIFSFSKLDKITKIIIKKSEKNELFNKRKIYKDDLIIYDNKKNILSIAGIVNINNKKLLFQNNNIFFIGSFFFDNKYISFLRNKEINSKIRFSNFLFEKCGDPNKTIFSLKRLSYILKKISKSIKIYGVFDLYNKIINPKIIHLKYETIINTIGEKINKEKVKKILLLSNFNIISENTKYFVISIPTYRLDIKRELDVVDEIIRIYGVNNINKNIIYDFTSIHSQNNFKYKRLKKIQRYISEKLVFSGFHEIISPSIIKLTKESEQFNFHFQRKNIILINPVDHQRKLMRSSLLFGMVDCLNYNYNKNRIISINQIIKIFEFGKIYYKQNNFVIEDELIAISVYNYNNKNIENTFFYLKGLIELIFMRYGICTYIQKNCDNPLLNYGIDFFYKKNKFSTIGKVCEKIVDNKKIFYAEINLKIFIEIIDKIKSVYSPLSKYPIVKRDISFLINKNFSFEKVNRVIQNQKKQNIIHNIKIYDIYENKNIKKNKISYTLSITFSSFTETLMESKINYITKNIESILIKKFNAEIRKNQ